MEGGSDSDGDEEWVQDNTHNQTALDDTQQSQLTAQQDQA